jgi:hypothetical protein
MFLNIQELFSLKKDKLKGYYFKKSDSFRIPKYLENLATSHSAKKIGRQSAMAKWLS